MSEFKPNSTDAMFATILERLKTQDELLHRIETGVAKTNGRVSSLELWRTEVSAKTAVISSIVSAVMGLVVSLILK